MLCEILNAKPLKQQQLPLFLCYENIKGKNFFFIVYSLIKKNTLMPANNRDTFRGDGQYDIIFGMMSYWRWNRLTKMK